MARLGASWGSGLLEMALHDPKADDRHPCMAERPLAVLAYDASCWAKSSGAAEADR